MSRVASSHSPSTREFTRATLCLIRAGSDVLVSALLDTMVMMDVLSSFSNAAAAASSVTVVFPLTLGLMASAREVAICVDEPTSPSSCFDAICARISVDFARSSTTGPMDITVSVLADASRASNIWQEIVQLPSDGSQTIDLDMLVLPRGSSLVRGSPNCRKANAYLSGRSASSSSTHCTALISTSVVRATAGGSYVNSMEPPNGARFITTVIACCVSRP